MTCQLPSSWQAMPSITTFLSAKLIWSYFSTHSSKILTRYLCPHMSRRAWTRGAGFWIIVDGACSEWCATDLHHAEEKMKFSARNCESSWKWRAKVPTWQHNRIKSIYVQFFILRENPTMFEPLETENHASLWECGVVLVLFTQLCCKVKHYHLYVQCTSEKDWMSI